MVKSFKEDKMIAVGALMGSKVPAILNLRFEPTDSILINIALATLRNK